MNTKYKFHGQDQLYFISFAVGSKNQSYRLWQQDNHPIELFDHKILHQKLDYIHYNPVVAGIVEKPEDYIYSSARDYYGLPGLIDIMIVDPLIQ